MPELDPLMTQLNNWNFPIFNLVEKTHGRSGCILSQVRTGLSQVRTGLSQVRTGLRQVRTGLTAR
jgi:X-X-X-Leu-X-X-Gly heptad repeat protein